MYLLGFSGSFLNEADFFNNISHVELLMLNYVFDFHKCMKCISSRHIKTVCSCLQKHFLNIIIRFDLIAMHIIELQHK